MPGDIYFLGAQFGYYPRGVLGSQRIKFSCIRQFFTAISDHLAFLDHMHQFDATQSTSGWSEGFEAGHGANDSFNCPVILLDEIVQVFDMTNLDGLTRFPLKHLKGTTLVDGNSKCEAMLANRFLEKAHGGFLVPAGGQ